MIIGLVMNKKLFLTLSLLFPFYALSNAAGVVVLNNTAKINKKAQEIQDSIKGAFGYNLYDYATDVKILESYPLSSFYTLIEVPPKEPFDYTDKYYLLVNKDNEILSLYGISYYDTKEQCETHTQKTFEDFNKKYKYFTQNSFDKNYYLMSQGIGINDNKLISFGCSEEKSKYKFMVRYETYKIRSLLNK